MPQEIVNRSVPPAVAASLLVAYDPASAKDTARYMMQQYHKHQEAHEYWCAVAYALEANAACLVSGPY